MNCLNCNKETEKELCEECQDFKKIVCPECGKIFFLYFVSPLNDSRCWECLKKT